MMIGIFQGILADQNRRLLRSENSVVHLNILVTVVSVQESSKQEQEG